MIDVSYARDVVMVGAVFAVAAFVWAGWAQENPPGHPAWRILLAGLSLAGVALAAVSIPTAIRHWTAPTAIDPQTRGFTVYLVVFWAEVIASALLVFLAIRAGRSDLVAPLILAVVGVHFFALTAVFQQVILSVAGAVLTVIAVVAVLLRRDLAAPSFWCGVLSAPVFLSIGGWCLVAGRRVLEAG